MQEMRTIKGLLSSESPTSLPFVDHLSQMERAVVATDRTLPGRDAVHICDREFDDLQLQRFIQHKARRYLIRAQHLARKVLWEGRRMTLKQAAQQVPLKQAGQVVRKGQAYDLWVGQTEVVFDGKSLRGVAKKRQMPRRGVPAEALQHGDMAVAAADQHEILHDRAGRALHQRPSPMASIPFGRRLPSKATRATVSPILALALSVPRTVPETFDSPPMRHR